jgi:4-azaleucine resistance transporter AzlC
MKNEFRNGFIANIPISISVFVYGTVLGMMCIPKGIALHELVLMNLIVFAGSSQFVMVEMWSNNLDILGIIIAALLINIRYFLIGASLNPIFVNSTKKDKFKYMHLVADENWAITMNRLKNEDITPLFLFGGGVCILFTWTLGTVTGYTLGAFISDPSKYGLDFAFIAVFTALVSSMYKGKQSIIPWIVTVFIALLCEHFTPGKSYIVLGAIAGSLSAALLQKEVHG